MSFFVASNDLAHQLKVEWDVAIYGGVLVHFIVAFYKRKKNSPGFSPF